MISDLGGSVVRRVADRNAAFGACDDVYMVKPNAGLADNAATVHEGNCLRCYRISAATVYKGITASKFFGRWKPPLKSSPYNYLGVWAGHRALDIWRFIELGIDNQNTHERSRLR